MRKNQSNMNLTEFMKRFPDEHSCRLHLKTRREKQGIVCKKCNCTRHYWLTKQWMWQCSNCNFRTSLKSGTMFENSNLSLYTWYLAMAFMCFSKKAVSACELQRQLRHSRYDTVWSLMHRIRNIMGNREALNYLMDEAEPTCKEMPVIATVERIRLRRRNYLPKTSDSLTDCQNIQSADSKSPDNIRAIRKIYMKVKENQGSDAKEKQNPNSQSILIQGGIKPGQTLAQIIEVIDVLKKGKNPVISTKWRNITTSNVKRILAGIYHNVHIKFLQLYLDEFCYKLNRRNVKDQIFERLIFASIQNPKLV